MTDAPWWRGAVTYQIYPRSFLDTNGDGVGDLPGIIARLDYVASLGVDAIWVAPFFKSPMADFGYDIADYRDVDPLFGSLEDFDVLLAKAHALNLKVMIDQVLSHTSNEHAWFRESRESRDNAKADWYVWADAKDDGSAPNNWLSLFGGSAWQWEPRRGQYYLHNFLTSQPDLNFHHADVRAAILDSVRFWLDKGVDGFRLDAINFCFHDRALRDNPPKPKDKRVGRGFSPDNPYAFQYHYFNNTQPENLAFLGELRALMDGYTDVAALGEISSEDSLATMAEYTRAGRLHMGYSFELLTDDFSAAHIRGTVQTLEAQMTEGWPCWAISNHDVERVLTRWGKGRSSGKLANLLTAMVCSLRGSVCVYQGEELGLTEAELPFEALQDPYGIAFWPQFKGRDGCRTPMPWNDADVHAGFSHGTPWLPVPSEHHALAVSRQEADPHSVLHGFRNFMHWRHGQPALRWGDIAFLDTAEPILAFTRRLGDQLVLVAFNLSEAALTLSLPDELVSLQPLEGHGLQQGSLEGIQLHLPGYGVWFAGRK
ncbi:alpha-glucosidase family protein [Rhodanobacter sp. AS-Z3]|uniref:alpha-glucosidase family protein n=1 Tax=Rhodanobacter sp. AS-Z3 TaxID=3031330 RepID=UPI002479F044|nr:alpha-glucosidase family protein [Rhodanobacter sp. AS-Z3]WEN14655.1 alpha-glucosidase family protein [Rhodanobacter sp. AS-Z3]